MTLASIQQFSTTAGSNTNINGISVATGWPPSNVGPAFREQMALLASSLVPLSLDITGDTSITLTAAQASAQFIQFIGAPGGNCTVTIPNALFVGMANNATIGGFSVILSAGAGTTATIAAGSGHVFYAADGATNVATFAPESSASYHDETSSRFLTNTYTNSVGKQMTVCVVVISSSPSTSGVVLLVNGMEVSLFQMNVGGAVLTVTGNVPAGAAYSVTQSGSGLSVESWLEYY
jgi:hypothetical protein